MPNPPKFDPARRSKTPGPLRLPAGGREGDVPAWPLLDDPSEAEWAAWGQLWATPQAAAWEKLGWTRTVGRYCRLMVAAESRDATAAIHAQATSLEDRLGLTPKAMRLLLWVVTDDEIGEKRASKRPTANSRRSVKAVEG